MGLLRDYNEGKLDELRTLKYSDFGSKGPGVQKDMGFDYNAINSRLTDVERVGKILISKPGLKFQLHQGLLQQNLSKEVNKFKNAVKKGGGGFKPNLSKLKDKAVDTLKNNAMSTLNTIAQVPVNGTGTHFVNNGGSTYLQQGESEQGRALGNFLRDTFGAGAGNVDGASSVLSGNLVDGIVANTTEGRLESEHRGKKLENIEDRGTYLGSTILKDLTLTADAAPIGFDSVSTDKVKREGSIHYREGDTSGQSTLNYQEDDQKKVEESYGPKKDYLNERKDSFSPSYDLREDGKNYLKSPLNIQTRLGLGDQGNKLSNANEGQDQLNKLAVSTQSLLGSDAKDIIPFEFNIFEPNKERFLYFRAFLDDFSDNYKGEWSGTKYIGRAEEFYTYQGFGRDISFSFKVAAFSKEELAPLYEKLNFLVASTAPSYASNGEFMKGTLCAVTVGDYLKAQDGFISSIGLSWDKAYPWEINLEDEKGVQILPHILDVAVSFTPIHDFNVKSDISYDTERYIG